MNDPAPSSAAGSGLRPAALTPTQKELLARATPDWAELPSGTGCASRSLAKLQTEGLVEVTLLGLLDYAADPHFFKWRWRLKPAAGSAADVERNCT